MAIDVDFELTVDRKGYRLEGGRIVGNGGPRWRKSLKEFPTLYLQFMKVQTPEALLDFVNKFGRLTKDDPNPKAAMGDDVRHVLRDAKTMSTVIGMVGDKKGNLPTWKGGAFKYEAAGFQIQGGVPLPGRLNAWLAPDPVTGSWQLQLKPPNLLDAIWLQFGAAITSNAQVRLCAQCGNPFEAGVGTGRRADAKFCSDRCQVKHKSEQRSRKEQH